MIQKIMPRINIVKQPVRAGLQKTAAAGLLLLAGSSMSGGYIRPSVTNDMVIPGGLNFLERSYYLLTGELPQSAQDRLEVFDDKYVPQEGDQVINLTMRGDHIEMINSKLHTLDGEAIESVKDLGENVSGEDLIDTIENDVDTDITTDDDNLTLFEIWKHLAGF